MPIGNILLNRFDQESNEFGIEDSGEYEDFPQVNDKIINEMSLTLHLSEQGTSSSGSLLLST